MRIAIALLIAVAVSACGTVQQTPTTVYSQPVVKSEHKFERTYELGVPMQAYVGEQMVRVQDYHVTEAQSGTTSTQLSATENFTLKIPPFMKVQVTPGEPIVVTGTTEPVLEALPVADTATGGAGEVKACTSAHAVTAPIKERYLMVCAVIQAHEQTGAVLKTEMAPT